MDSEHLELIKTAVIDRINISNYASMDRYDRAQLLFASRQVLGLSQREFSKRFISKDGKPLPHSTYHDWELPLKIATKQEFEHAITTEGERNLYLRLRNKKTSRITNNSLPLDIFLRDTIVNVRVFTKKSDLTSSNGTEELVRELQDCLNRLLMYIDRSNKKTEVKA